MDDFYHRNAKSFLLILLLYQGFLDLGKWDILMTYLNYLFIQHIKYCYCAYQFHISMYADFNKYRDGITRIIYLSKYPQHDAITL